jgi:GNAT superfamily N-acetyltransferase
MRGPFAIEPAQPQDIGELLRLIRALADYERLSQAVVATAELLHESLFGERAVGAALLARADGRAVGMAIYFANLSTFLGRSGIYLEDLFVEPDYRGRGIGRALLQQVARIAVARGCRRMEWSALDWNAPAIGFYKHVGAQPLDEWTVFRLAGPALDAFAAAEPGGDALEDQNRPS